jgi:hypothetical protein
MRRLLLAAAIWSALTGAAFAQAAANCVVVNGVSQCANGVVFLSGLTVSVGQAITFGTDTTLSRSAAGKVTLTGTTPMLQLGGITSSFPALKRSGNAFQVRLADDSAFADLTANNLLFGVGLYAINVLATTTPPTLGTCTGFGTSPAMGTTNGTAAFLVTVGTAPPAGGTCTVTLPTAATGWNCSGEFRTSTATMKETSTTTTTAVLTVAGTPTAGETAQLRCVGY